MEKLRFDFVVKATPDGKSNIICVTSIATPNGQVYEIPPDYQPASLHGVITNTSNYAKVKKSFNKRHQTRKIWITLTDEISKIYLDEEQNLQFHDFYLEEIEEKANNAESMPSGSNQSLEKLLEKLLEEKQQKTETQNLGKIAKDFMIEKFTGRNSNAHQWLQDFNKECERFQIIEDKKKIEILKNFLENSSVDWYSCMLIKLTVESEWSRWEKNFCETFGNKGWSATRYALGFKYQAGSLLEYALKKEKLLLDVRKSVDTGTLIDLIAFGLPNYVADRIDRETLQDTEDLYNELGKLEHLVARNKYDKKKYFYSDAKPKKVEDKKPCQICINEKKGKRFHPEENCWYKEKNQKAVVKTVNNSALEIELNEKNPKKLEVAPLIKIELLLNDTLRVSGIYDSGSNVSLINAKLLKIQQQEGTNDINIVNLKTINGDKKTKGLVTLKIKIYDIENNMDIFVVDNENFNYDFLIGLDCIKKFKLIQDEDLKITQSKNALANVITTNKEAMENNYSDDDNKVPNVKIPDVLGDNKEKGSYLYSEVLKKGINHLEKCEINFNEHVNSEKFDISVNHLDLYQKSEIDKIIDKYKQVFAKDKYDIGTVRGYEAHIDLMVDKYCYKRPYRCTTEDRKEIESQISKLLKNNLIEESYSPFAAPVTLAYKKEDERKTRLCIDFRDLNKIVIPQSQPFPLIEDLMIKTVNCKYFSTFDVNSAFWSIPMKIQDRHKTAFVTQDGHFQWTCLPFGLKTAPAIFQRILSNIIRKHELSNFAVNFIDDILVFSKTFEEHKIHISRLLEAILKEEFRLKFSKCVFASNSAKYLGHIIENNSVRPLKDYLSAVKDFPVPETRKNIRQFLGKINFHHKFIPHTAIILDPLHNLLRKDVKFIWSAECQESFDKIKALLCSEPVLKIFDPDLPISIYTDASIKGVGAVLKQEDENGNSKPVAFFSKKLNETQKKKKAIYLECLAIKEAVKYWQHWIMGKEFTVYSDHKPLENMNIKSRTDEELGDLTYYLSQYTFKVKYNPGKTNQEADCLSRNPVLEACDNSDDFLKIVNLITITDIKKDQHTNIRLKNDKNEFILENEIYYKKHKRGKKIILSEGLSKTLIKDVHNTYCHLGRTQLTNKITPFYTAENLTANIKQICDECETCIKNKSRRKPKYGLMSQLGPATRPFEIVSIDTIGGFGGSRSTKKYLHLLVDHFTRYAYMITSKNQNANDFIKLIKFVTQSYNIDMILTDQYPGINSKDFKDYLKKENIKIIFTAVDSPFSNGLNERLNQTLTNKIRCKINERNNKTAWTTIAHKCVEKYNETEHTVTKFAPKYLLEGENLNILPAELKSKFTTEDLQRDRNIALSNTRKSHNYNKKIFDLHRKDYKFEVGDSVYVENGNRLNRKKTEELRIGPYKILNKISNCIYEVDTGQRKMESNLYHITKLTPVL